MMAKKSTKRLAVMLAIVMTTGVLLPVRAQEEGIVTEKETVTNADSTVTEQTTTTTTEIDFESGDVTVTIEIEKDTTGTTPAGEDVNKSELTTATTVTDSESNLLSETYSETTVESVVDNGVEKVISSGASGGTEYSTGDDGPEDVTLPVPMTDTDDPETTGIIENQSSVEFGDPVGTEKTSGDIPASSDDGEYDYVKETTVEQGKVTITNTDITVSENVVTENTDLEHIKSETSPDGSNDIFHQEASLAPEQYLPGYTGETEQSQDSVNVQGYDYIYVGTNNTSMYRPAVVFTDPLTDEQKPSMLTAQIFRPIHRMDMGTM